MSVRINNRPYLSLNLILLSTKKVSCNVGNFQILYIRLFHHLPKKKKKTGKSVLNDLQNNVNNL